MQNEQWHLINFESETMNIQQVPDAAQYTIFSPLSMPANVPPHLPPGSTYHQFFVTSEPQTYSPLPAYPPVLISDIHYPLDIAQASTPDEALNTARSEENTRPTSTVKSTPIDGLMNTIQRKIGSGPADDTSPLHSSTSKSSGIPKRQKKLCVTCGKKVLGLPRHMLTHTDRKPYVCLFLSVLL